ncbi:MAG: D-alanine--D-alanine ligase [Chloroflexi bacterium]|nr:D-alanine--D-alanine ligase [Chloroflexota bacterium]
MTPTARPPIAVLVGGPSAEHDVSIVSGTAIAEALADAGCRVTVHLISLDGGWWRLPDGHRRDGRPLAAYDDPAAVGAMGATGAAETLTALAASDPSTVVFIALHGPFGEDGTVQALVEAAGLAFTGSGVAASAIGMDKPRFKALARGAGLPVLDWLEIPARRWTSERAEVLAELEAFGRAHGDGRLIVKPAGLGSSVGMTIAHAAAERPGALDEALRFDGRAVVEPYLERPRELEVAVLGNDEGALRVFGPGEVTPGREFYDYADKYLVAGARTTPTADLPSSLAAEARRLAAATFTLVGAAGFARVDGFLAGDGRLLVSEINTIPGFTPISLFPAMAMAGGLGFSELCLEIVDLALAARAARPNRRLRPADLPR